MECNKYMIASLFRCHIGSNHFSTRPIECTASWGPRCVRRKQKSYRTAVSLRKRLVIKNKPYRTAVSLRKRLTIKSYRTAVSLRKRLIKQKSYRTAVSLRNRPNLKKSYCTAVSLHNRLENLKKTYCTAVSLHNISLGFRDIRQAVVWSAESVLPIPRSAVYHYRIALVARTWSRLPDAANSHEHRQAPDLEFIVGELVVDGRRDRHVALLRRKA